MIERVHVRARSTPCPPSPRTAPIRPRRISTSRWRHVAVSPLLPLLRVYLGTSQRVKLLCAILLILSYAATVFVCVSSTSFPSVYASSMVPPSQSKHILIVSLSLRGHVVPLTRLATELVQRGHRVSFAVQEDGRDYVNKTGARFVSLGRTPFQPNERREKLRQICHDSSFFRGLLSLVNDVYLPSSLPVYKSLTTFVIRDRPDVMVIDIGALGGLDVAQRNHIPYIINNPSVIFRMDNSPPYVPAWGSGFSQHMTLWERCLSLLYPRLLSVALTPTFMDINKLRYQRDLPLYKSPNEMFENSLVMVNTAFGFEYPFPVTPLIKMTGPLMPSVKPTLSSQLSYWLDKSSKPVVLVLFGSGSMSYLESWQVKQIAQGLSDSRFRVLWALRSEEKALLGPNLPNSFRIKSNFPQLPVIAHSAVRVVMSACGMGTAQEALYYGKTLLCVPMLGDQVDVAARVVDAGAGLTLDKNRLEVADISKSILTLYRNASYRLAAKRVGKILRSMGGCQQAVELVEYAIHPGIKHLQEQHKLPWHQQHQLDLLAVLFSILCICVLMLRTCWLLLLHVYSKISSRIPMTWLRWFKWNETSESHSTPPTSSPTNHVTNHHTHNNNHVTSTHSTGTSTLPIHLAHSGIQLASTPISTTIPLSAMKAAAAANAEHARHHVWQAPIEPEDGDEDETQDDDDTGILVTNHVHTNAHTTVVRRHTRGDDI